MEIRAGADASVDTADYQLLSCLSRRGAATIPEIEKATGHGWAETVNNLTSLMNRGYIEATSE